MRYGPLEGETAHSSVGKCVMSSSAIPILNLFNSGTTSRWMDMGVTNIDFTVIFYDGDFESSTKPFVSLERRGISLSIGLLRN